MIGHQIVINFNRRIKRQFYKEYINVACLTLEEKKEKDCVFNILLDNETNNHFLVIQDLEELKVNSALYIHKDPPEDCDYVILDLKKKIIYLIELKKKKSMSLEGPSDLQSQLKSGKQWVEHLLFCADIENIFINPDWKIYWGALNHRPGRPPRKFIPRVVHRYDWLERPLPIFEGNFFPLKVLEWYR